MTLPASVTLLRDRLEQQLGRRGVHADLTEFENGETFLKAAKERPFTVLFLDIYMDGANGIEIARELRGFDPDCLLIFTTTSTDHALDGFKVRALHYLVKPYNEKEISELMDEVLSRIPDSREVHRCESERQQHTGSLPEHCVCGAFFPYDPHSYYKDKRTGYPPVL